VLRSHHRLLRPQLPNLVHNGFQVRQHEIVMHLANPRGLEEQRRAAGRPGCLGVLPLVADDKGAVEVKVPFEGRLDEQARVGFAAGQ